MNRRTSFMVANDILIEATKGSSKTNLVYRCNLNFKIIKKWLSILIAKGLIESYSEPSKTWRTTEKGLRFISTMERVLWIWDNNQMNTELDLIPSQITPLIKE